LYLCTIFGKNLLTSIIFITFAKNLNAMNRIFVFLTATILCAGMVVGCSPKSNKPLRAGTVVRDTLNGTPCCVYLPNEVPSTKYPVLYLQHGMYGNEDDWTRQGRLVEIMDSLRQAGEVKEMVVIMPDNCPGRPVYEEEKENAMNGAWEANFASFMAEAESRYRISSDPSQRAVAGLSMGGYHTKQVTQTLPGQFGFIGLFSALVTPPHSMEGNEETLYWIAIGQEDFLFDTIQSYRHWLDANHYEYTYYQSAGGHVWENWQDYICRFLQKLF
jgi:enterochelin esterase family protein